MRIRSLVTSVAVVGSLVAGVSPVHHAFAQKGQVLSPSTAWAVTKVDNAAGPYCAMARQFNQSTVLTIARNQSSETSFALDFQRPVFQGGEGLRVILDPGAGQQRAYKISPVSNKAFVVRLGRDESFFNALQRTGLLRVEMNGQSYHFGVADIDTGEARLDACVASMVMPAAGEESPLTPVPGEAAATQQAATSFRQEINALRQQVNALQDKNKALKTQLETRSEGPAEIASSVSQLSGQITRLEDENATLKQQLELAKVPAAPADVTGLSAEESAALSTLRDENLRLKAELQTAQPQTEAVAELEAKLSKLESQNASLKEAVDSQGQGEALVAKLQGQIRELEAQNAALDEQVGAARADLEKDYQQQVAALNAENAALKANMDKKGVDAGLLEQLRQQIAQAENENRLLRETAAQAQQNLETQLTEEKMAAVEEAKAQQADKVAGLEKELELLRGENTNSTQQAERIAALQKEVDALKSENAEKAKQLLDVGESASTLQALQEENATLTEKLAAAQLERSQAETMLKKVETLEAENSNLQEELRIAQQAQKEAPDAAGVEEQLAALKLENEKLQEKVESGRKRGEKIAALEAQVRELQDNNTALEAKAQDTAVQTALEDAQRVNDELRAQIEEKDLQLSEMDVLRQKLAEMETQSAAVSHDESDALQGQVAALEAQRDEMKDALRDVVAVAEDYKAANAEQAQELAVLESQVESLKAQKQDQKQKDVAAAPVATKASAQPREDAPVVKAEKEPVAEEKVSVADVPTPGRKPAAPLMRARDPAPVAEPVAGDITSADAAAGMPPSVARLIEIEQEMRETNPDDPRMQVLAQEYMALKQRVEQMDAIQQGAAANAVRRGEPSAGGDAVDVAAAVQPETVGGSDEPAQDVMPEPAFAPDFSSMNEAQIQEMALKNGREASRGDSLQAMMAIEEAAAAPVDPPVTASATPPEEAPEEIVMSASADPFEDMAVEDEGGREIVAETKAAPAVREPVTTISPPVAEAPASAPSSGFSVAELITAASVSTPDKIKKVDQAQGDFDVAYQWNGGQVYGSAEQKPLASPAQFDDLVKDYLERTQSRCPGDFAIVPDNTVEHGSVRADSYEVACVGQDVSSGASLLFFNEGGTFTVVAHEAPAEALGMAMNYRNQVMKIVTQGS